MLAAGHRPIIAWSGGKDSTVAAALVREQCPDVPVVLADSGLEFPETLAYADLLAGRGWNVQIVHGAETTRQLMARMHWWEHDVDAPDGPAVDFVETTLRQPICQALADHDGDTIVWGLRRDESSGRARLLTRTRGWAWNLHTQCWYAAPVWPWPTEAVWAWLDEHGIPVNPVYDRMREIGVPDGSLRLSAMLGANGLGFGRLAWLRRGWPELFDQLAAEFPRMKEFT